MGDGGGAGPDPDEGFAPLSTVGLSSVGFLADRVCIKFSRWGAADAGQVRLYLVPHEGIRKPLAEAEAEASAALLDEPALSLVDAGVLSGAWLLARVSLPAAAAVAAVSAGAADAGRVAALLEQVLAGQARDRAERAREAERAYLGQLCIRPVFSPPSSGGSSNRSLRDESTASR